MSEEVWLPIVWGGTRQYRRSTAALMTAEDAFDVEYARHVIEMDPIHVLDMVRLLYPTIDAAEGGVSCETEFFSAYQLAAKGLRWW